MDCSDVSDINNYYVKGEEYIVQEEYEKAIELFDEALSKIGYSYLLKDVKDSTGQKLTLAKVFQK